MAWRTTTIRIWFNFQKKILSQFKSKTCLYKVKIQKQLPGKCRGRVVMRTEDTINWYLEKRWILSASELCLSSDILSLYDCKAWTSINRHFSWYCFSKDTSSNALYNTFWIPFSWICISHSCDWKYKQNKKTTASWSNHISLTDCINSWKLPAASWRTPELFLSNERELEH